MLTESVVDPEFLMRRVRFRRTYVPVAVKDWATDWPDHTVKDGSPPPIVAFFSNTISPNPRAGGATRTPAIPLASRATMPAITRQELGPRVKVLENPPGWHYIISAWSLSPVIH